MARVDCCGAEKSSVLELDSTAVFGAGAGFQASAAQFRAGSRSWLAELGGAALITDSASGTMQFPATYTTVSVFFAMYIPSATRTTGSEVRVAAISGGFPSALAVRLVAITSASVYNVRLEVINVLGTVGGSNQLNGFAYDRWNLFCVRGTTTPTGQNNTWFLRGNSAEIQATANTGADDIRSFEFGVVSQTGAASQGFQVFIDDIIVDNGSAPGLIPDASFLSYHQPDADVTTQWNTNGAGGSHRARLTDNDTDTGIAGGNGITGSVDELSLGDLAGSLPADHTSIVALYGSTVDGPGVLLPADYLFIFRDGGVNGPSSNVTASGVNATTHRSVRVSPNAAGGVPWTVSKLNDTNIRVVLDAGVGRSARIEEMWAYAEIQVAVDFSGANAEVATAQDEVTQINALASIEDVPVGAEATSVLATAALDDLAGSVTEQTDVFATIALSDAGAAAESAQQVTFIREDLCVAGGDTVFISSVME